MAMAAPTGVDWSLVPTPQSDGSAAQASELVNICWRASGWADSIANQPLRSTLSVETVQGPDYRMTVDASGTARVMTSRWPVTEILGAQVSPRAAIPRSWSAVPVTAMALEDPPITYLSPVVEGAAGAGGQAVLVAPGYVSWCNGRNGFSLQLAYLNGWPHAGVTAAVAEGAETVAVDDVTGMAGAQCTFYDGSSTETVTVASATATSPVTLPSGGTAQAGPGTLTLSAGTAFAHAPGTVVSALPGDIQWAVILHMASQVLTMGATSVAVPEISGGLTSTGNGAADLKRDAVKILKKYARVL